MRGVLLLIAHFCITYNVFRAQLRPREAGVYQLLHHVVDAMREASSPLCLALPCTLRLQCCVLCVLRKALRALLYEARPTAKRPHFERVFFRTRRGTPARRRRRRARRGWLGSLCDLAWLARPSGGACVLLRRCCPLTPPGNGGAGVGRLPRWLASREQQLWTGDAARSPSSLAGGPFPAFPSRRCFLRPLALAPNQLRRRAAVAFYGGSVCRPASRRCVRSVGFRGLRVVHPPHPLASDATRPPASSRPPACERASRSCECSRGCQLMLAGYRALLPVR